MSLALNIQILNNFQYNGASGETLKNKLHFLQQQKWNFLFESFSPSLISLEFVENWQKECHGHKKDGPVFQVLVSAHAPPPYNTYI